MLPVLLSGAHLPEKWPVSIGQAKVINYMPTLKSVHKHLMRDYSYYTASSIINAFEKSVNFHFNE